MASLLSLHKLEKHMGAKLLFEGLTLGIFEREKIGLIGPNGSGKSTLLKILADLETYDSGSITKKKNLRASYIKQVTDFDEDMSVKDFMVNSLNNCEFAEKDQIDVMSSMYISIAGFENEGTKIKSLSGGWRKRLVIAASLAEEPELLILDEPTNHMDWEGVLWLEGILKSANCSFILVSHDRFFLNKLTNRTIEISSFYNDGFISYDCSYNEFLIKKEKYIEEQQKLLETMSNKARREVDWLRAGVKARTTKSQSRIKEAHQLLDNLSDVKSKSNALKTKTRLEIDSTQRKTKKLVSLKGVEVSYPDKLLIKKLDLDLGPKTCIGLLGSNGSGKTSLIRVISKKMEPTQGEVFWADDLKIVYLDQKRESLPKDETLMQYLGDGSDYLVFKDTSIHVASYASRFLFPSEKLNMKIDKLSGGEQARLLIAKTLTKPADILIMDEPTNDLDIDTIEILEGMISDFPGLVLLVSHDRTFLENLCQRFLGLNGKGEAIEYASIEQWVKNLGKEEGGEESLQESIGLVKEKSFKPKSKLSYKEKKQLESIESDISKAEVKLSKLQEKLSNPDITEDKVKLNQIITEVSDQQKIVDQLYLTWDELEAKKG